MKLLTRYLKSWWFPWVLVGVLIRLILSPVTIHSHAYDLNFTSFLLSFKGVTNIYDYLANLPDGNPWVQFYSRGVFTYPPLAYFTLGGFMFLLKPFFNLDFMTFLVNHPMAQSLGDPRLFSHLLLLKIPYLFFDLGTAYFLVKMFTGVKDQKRVLLLWIFNPLSLYTSFIVSQFDIIPVFFIVLALFLASKNQKGRSLVALGFGASYKMFPLFLVPIFAFILGVGLKERIKLLIVGVVPYILTFLPFLTTPAFRQVCLFSNQSQKMLFMDLPVSGAEGLMVFAVLLLALYFLVWYRKIKKENLWLYSFAVFGLYFSVTHYHPQWFLWITPFYALILTLKNFKYALLVFTFFLSWFLLTILFEASLSYGAFSPLWPNLATAKSLSDAFPPYLDLFQIKSLLRSLFAAGSLFLIYDLFTSKQTSAD